MAEKDSFVLYNSYYDLIEDLNMEQRGLLLTAILEHARGENQPVLDPIVKIAYRVIAAQLDRDHKKWEETCARRAEAGRKGGIAKANNAKQDAANLASASGAKQNVANLAKASNAKQSLANLAEYEYESESDNEAVPLTAQEYIDFRDSFRKKFIESFGREPDRPFLSGVRNKLEHVPTEEVWKILKLAAGKHPRNPEAYILAALKQKQEHRVAYPQQTAYPEQDPNAPLADWEVQWLAEVRRRQERQKQDGEQLEGEEANV